MDMSSHNHDDGVSAAFMQNHRGMVCIAFADPEWVRADMIVVDRPTGSIHAILHESQHFIGHVSEAMASAFASRKEALLTALRPDGTIFEMMTPVKA